MKTTKESERFKIIEKILLLFKRDGKIQNVKNSQKNPEFSLKVK